MDKRTLGEFGENAAAQFLRCKGYRIIARNYSCKFGELDIIARKGDYIVFVEVKLRKNADFAEAREFVTAAKQRRIISTAALWLAQNESDLQPRFDVIEVYAPEGKKTIFPKINHIIDAFQ